MVETETERERERERGGAAHSPASTSISSQAQAQVIGGGRGSISSSSSPSTTFALRLHEAIQVALDQEDISTVLRAALELGQESAVCIALDKCIGEDGKEIEQLCRKNCLDFVETMTELSALREDSLGLKQTVEEHCDQILKRGQPQLKLMEELAQCCRSISSYRESRQALETSQTVLELLERAETGLHTRSRYNNSVANKHKSGTFAGNVSNLSSASSLALDPTNPFGDALAEESEEKDTSNPFLEEEEESTLHAKARAPANHHHHVCGSTLASYVDGNQKKYYDVLSCLDKVHRLLDNNDHFEVAERGKGKGNPHNHNHHRHKSGGLGLLLSQQERDHGLGETVLKKKKKQMMKSKNSSSSNNNDDFESMQCNVVSTSKRLAKFLSRQVAHVEGEMQQVIGEDFNEWLLEARTSAKEVAQRKMRHARAVMREAAQVGAKQQDMVRVIRANWGKPLKDILAKVVLDQRGASPSSSSSPFEANRAPTSDDGDGLDDHDPTNPFASPSPADKRRTQRQVEEKEKEEEESNDALSSLNFATLHRCRYLYGRLNRSEVFADYYRRQRGLQLASDLERRGGIGGEGRHSFFDQISETMDRILGFLIIEDKVLHTTRDIITAEDIQAMWEEASGVLLDRLESWLAERRLTGQNYLAEAGSVCSHVALFCTVVAHYGLRIKTLKDFTERALECYGKTLQSECTQWVAAICKEDLSRKLPKAQNKDKDKEWYLDLSKVTAMGRRNTNENGNVNVTATVTDYSESLPEVVNLMLSLLQDSLAFIEGTQIGEDLTFPSSLFDNDSRQQIEEIAHSIVKFCILPAMKDMIKDPHNDLSEATQLMANIYFGLIPAFHGLDSFVQVLCSSRSLEEAVEKMREESNEACLLVLQSPDYVAKGHPSKGPKSKILPRDALDMLYEVMDLSEENVLEILCAKVDSYSANYIMMDWCPSDFPSSSLVVQASDENNNSPAAASGGDPKESECVHEIVAFIEKISEDSKQYMPPYLHGHLFSQLFKHAADHILRLLSCSAVSKFNLISIMQVKADMKFLKRVAVKILEDEDVDLLFAGLVQVLDYLLSCLPESILDPKVRQSLYPMINTQMLGRLLYKYTEVKKEQLNQGNSNLNISSTIANAPTKAAVEAVAQKLLASV